MKEDFFSNRKYCLILFLVVIVLSASAIYGIHFQRQFPTVRIGQSDLYGVSGSNLKDFSLDSNGKITALSDDPWVSYSLEEPEPVAAIQIKAMDTQDKSGYAHIFDTDSWKDTSGRLLNGINQYYTYSHKDLWVTQNFRFDLVEFSGASCIVSGIVINPVIPVFLIGFMRLVVPLLSLLIVLVTIAKLFRKIKTSDAAKVKLFTSFSLKLLCSAIAAYFVLLNLRIVANSTTAIAGMLCLFAIFSVKRPEFQNKRVSNTLWLLSVLLVLANSMGSHISIGQQPYSDLMDTSFITAYGWKDVVGIPLTALVFYRTFSLVLYWLPEGIRVLRQRKIFQVRPVSFVGPMIIMFVCWIPYLILYYPGFILGDSVSSIEQALGSAGLSNHHPVLYTLFIRTCIRIGMMYGNLAFGIAIYSVLQMFFVSFSLAKMISWLSKHGCPMLILCMITGCFALMPFFGQVSVAMWKDPLFGASAVLWTLCLLGFMEAVKCGDAKERKKYVLLGIPASLLVCFSRNNGIYAVAFFVLAFCIEAAAHYKNFRKARPEMLLPFCCVLVIFSYLIVTGPVFRHLEINPSERVESVGICLNQMARVAASPDGVLSDEDREYMNNLLPIEEYPETYRPCVVDLFKHAPDFHEEYFNSHMREFVKRYFSIGLKNPGKYVEAWALMTFGYWTPNRWELCNDTENLFRGNFGDLLDSGLKIEQVDMNNLPDNFLYKLFPNRGTIIELAIVDWLVFVAFLLAVLANDRVGMIGLLPSIGIIITLIIASPYWYWPRYGMAQFYLAPVYFYFIGKDIYKLKVGHGV